MLPAPPDLFRPVLCYVRVKVIRFEPLVHS